MRPTCLRNARQKNRVDASVGHLAVPAVQCDRRYSRLEGQKPAPACEFARPDCPRFQPPTVGSRWDFLGGELKCVGKIPVQEGESGDGGSRSATGAFHIRRSAHPRGRATPPVPGIGHFRRIGEALRGTGFRGRFRRSSQERRQTLMFTASRTPS